MTIKQSLKKMMGEKKLLFLNGVDAYQRYKEISLLIPKSESVSMLDVGGGNARLSLFIDKKIYCLDSSLNSLNNTAALNICADGCNLPFKDNSVDYVTSAACLEHLPKVKRTPYLKELKRVCRIEVIIYTPLSPVAMRYDQRLVKLKKYLLVKDRWTEEHLKYGLPEDGILLANGFKKLKEIQNANIWIVYMVIQSIPLIRFLSGILYVSLLKHFDNKPPFIGGIFEYNKY